MKCVSYTRNTIRYGVPLSIEEQNKKIAAFAKAHHIKVSKKFSDTTENIEDTDAFFKMKEDMIGRKHDCLLAVSMDYLGTNPLTGYGFLTHTAVPSGMNFGFVEDDFLSSEHTAKEVQEYLQEKYDMHKRNRNINTVQSMHRKAWGTFYGYQRVGNALIIDETVAPIVREIFNMGLEGKTYTEIANILNARNVPTPVAHLERLYRRKDSSRPIQWESAYVSRILRDVRYTGVWQTKYMGSVLQEKIDAYISKEEYQKLQDILASRKSKPNEENPFRGRIFDRESHLMLYMDNQDSGRKAFLLREKPENYDEYILKSITMEAVTENVLLQLEKERQLAKKVLTLIDSEEGQIVYEQQRENILNRAQDKLNELLMETDRSMSADIDELTFPQMDQLDDELNGIMAELNEIEMVFSQNNLWLKRYSGFDAIDHLDLKFGNKLIKEVLVERFEKVIFIPQHEEWKQKLPASWLED